MKNKACLSARQGFTLIELLVVIAILGLLATIILFSVDTAKSKSRDSHRATDIKFIQEGLSMYYNDYSFYPSSEGESIEIDGSSDFMSQGLIDSGNMFGVPVDPINKEIDGVTYKYFYESFDNEGDYELIFYLETNSILNKLKGINIVYP